MYILLPTIEYVHNINGSSCGMIGTLEHFGYCVDAESVNEFVAGFTAVNVVSVSAYTGYCLLWSVAPVLYGWSKQPNKAGTSPKWFSWLTSYVVLKIKKKKKKKTEDFVKHKYQPYHCSFCLVFLKSGILQYTRDSHSAANVLTILIISYLLSKAAYFKTCRVGILVGISSSQFRKLPNKDYYSTNYAVLLLSVYTQHL